VPQVRRVFVFAPNLGWHKPQPEQYHSINDLGAVPIEPQIKVGFTGCGKTPVL
jgi:hypothetical protein